jgi:Leucine-rich repeat (LRR) protein
MLSTLKIEGCVKLECLQGLNYLVECPNRIMTIEEAEKVQRLIWITVDDIPFVPRLLSRKGFLSLRTLSIRKSDEPREEEILQQFPSLGSLYIQMCQWSSLPENLGTLAQLQVLVLQGCPNVPVTSNSARISTSFYTS